MKKVNMYATFTLVLLFLVFAIDYAKEIIIHKIHMSKKNKVKSKNVEDNLSDYILDIDKVIISEDDWIEE